MVKKESQGTRHRTPAQDLKAPLYGLVLIGGKSTRMGRDKSRIKYHAQEQYIHCFELLSRHCDQVFISCRPGQRINKRFPQIHDHKDLSSRGGPLSGILSALRAYPDAAWLVLACDLPLVDEQTISYLIRKRNPNKLATAYGNSVSYLPEPLCAIYEPVIRPRLLNFRKKGIFCPRKILIHSNFELLALKNSKALDNANSPEEFMEFSRKLS